MSKGRYRIHQFENGIYPLNLFIIVDNRLDFFAGNFEHADGKEMDLSEVNAITKAFSYKDCLVRKQSDALGFAIVFKHRKDIDARTMTHESFHSACFYADAVGLEFVDGGNNEEFAYLIGWIADCIDKVKKGNKTTE